MFEIVSWGVGPSEKDRVERESECNGGPRLVNVGAVHSPAAGAERLVQTEHVCAREVHGEVEN